MGSRGRRGRHVTRTLEIQEGQLILSQSEIVLTQTPYERPLPPPDSLIYRSYDVVASCWDGERTPFYPLLPQDRAWMLVARDGASLDDPAHALLQDHTFGMSQPTLRWMNGKEVIEVYVDGMTTDNFCQHYGVAIDITKNEFVTCKRLSRLFRDYRMSARLPDSEVRVTYMDLDADGEKQWDGSGLISRAMLEKIQISPHLPEVERDRLRAELRHIQRVEFTMNNAVGQHKGHAIVVDDLPVEFHLPRDIKKDVKLTDGTTFVGINLVHHDERMRLDIQSMMNLHPFFSADEMLKYLDQHEQLFYQAVDSGQKGEAMARLSGATRQDLVDSPLREYAASGGNLKAFPSMVNRLFSGAIESIDHSLERGKLRIPYPGGRYYVMSGAVAQAAGLNIPLKHGQVHLDPATSTAWVHPDDWLHLQDSPNRQGIRDILGGADQDDALWVNGFTDYDGQRKVLAWRSPNNVGEYIVLEPSEASQPILWHTPEGDTLVDPQADSRTLPVRIDVSRHEGRTLYRDLVEPAPSVMGRKAYSVEAIEAMRERTLANDGVLGTYCNYVMAYKALRGEMPPELPCGMEEVVDATVKTGDDLSQVKTWLQQATQNFIRSGVEISPLMAPRLGIFLDEQGSMPSSVKVGQGMIPLKSTDGHHWTDQLEQGVRANLARLTERRNTLMQQARLPNAVYDSVATDADALALGGEFNQRYALATREAQQKYDALVTANSRTERRLHEKQQKRRLDLISAYVTGICEDFLQRHPEERQRAILRGAMVSREIGGSEKRASRKAQTPKRRDSLYTQLNITSDAALWQRGLIAQRSMEALREVGVIGRVEENLSNQGKQLVRYPPTAQVNREATYESASLSMLWYRALIEEAHAKGRTAPHTWTGIPRHTQVAAKNNVKYRAARPYEQGGYIGMPLYVDEDYLSDHETQKRLVWVDPRGRIFGAVDKNNAARWQIGDEAVIRQAKADTEGRIEAKLERRM